jgi:hypothetical protein
MFQPEEVSPKKRQSEWMKRRTPAPNKLTGSWALIAGLQLKGLLDPELEIINDINMTLIPELLLGPTCQILLSLLHL